VNSSRDCLLPKYGGEVFLGEASSAHISY